MVIYKKKQKNVTDNDPNEYGDVYTLTAMESDTKLFISHHEGGRSTDNAVITSYSIHYTKLYEE